MELTVQFYDQALQFGLDKSIKKSLYPYQARFAERVSVIETGSTFKGITCDQTG